MKKTFLLLVVTLVSLVSIGQPISMNTARERAEAFMNEHGSSLENTTARARQIDDDAYAPLYVFNAKAGGGFIVISGDERTAEVLGYSTSGTYSTDNMPPAFAEWLSTMEREISSLPDTVAIRTASDQEGQLADIKPLIKTKWGQSNNIFNRLCPVVDGVRTPSGCGATVAAQLMYYYQYPTQSTDTIPSYETRQAGLMPSLAPITFDYESMKCDFSAGYSDASAQAVSELMLFAGCAMQMNYAPGGSSTYMSNLQKAMLDYFGYDRNTTRTVKRANYTTIEWNRLIYSELQKERPVIYMGYSENVGGHVFLCDGYRDGFYHINWGWNGNNDGFFRLWAMNPYNDSMTTGFSLLQEAIVGLKPATNSSDETAASVPSEKSGKADIKVDDVQFGNLITVLQRVEVTATNAGDGDYSNNLYLFASNNGVKPTAYTYRSGLALESGASEHLDLYFNPTSEGYYSLWITTDELGNNVIYQDQVKVSALGTEAKLQLTDYKVDPLSVSTCRLSLSLSNISEGILYSSIWVIIEDDMSVRVDEIRSEKKTLYPSQKMEFTCTLQNLEAGKNYHITMLYFPCYGTLQTKTFGLSYSHNFTSGISPTSADHTQTTDYYGLNGRKRTFPAVGLNIIRMADGTVKKVIRK